MKNTYVLIHMNQIRAAQIYIQILKLLFQKQLNTIYVKAKTCIKGRQIISDESTLSDFLPCLSK